MNVVGLSGKIGVGKTAIAVCMVDTLNAYFGEGRAVRLSFADDLRREAADMFGFDPSLALTQTGKRAMVQHPDLPGGLGTVRDALIYLGKTRRREHPGYWAERLDVRLNALESGGTILAVVDDMRFADELQMLRTRGGYLVRVVPYTSWEPGPHAGDESETALDGREDWDQWVRPKYGRDGVLNAASAILDACWRGVS